MKIIFSRKGFDSKFGRADSPILPDNRMVSIPIPANGEKGIAYDKIFYEQSKSYLDLMKELEIEVPQSKQCHLDPDLRSSTIKRDNGWKPIFGQDKGFKTHLCKTEKVSKGDIFLFFGSFRKTSLIDNKHSFNKGHSRHIIFGYLIIDEIWDLGKEGIQNFKKKNSSYSWAFKHPHFCYEKEIKNAIFVSSD